MQVSKEIFEIINKREGQISIGDLEEKRKAQGDVYFALSGT